MKKLNKKGFTIVELVIVIGVIGILSAILIPTFVNLTSQAKEKQIQANLRNAYAAYISEAVDGEIVKDAWTGTSGSRTAVKKIAISDLAENEVTLKLDDKYYNFKADGTWDDAGVTDPTDYVVEESKYYSAATDGPDCVDLALELSTYNGVVVYAKA